MINDYEFKNMIKKSTNLLLGYSNGDEPFVSGLSEPCFITALKSYFCMFNINIQTKDVYIKENPIEVSAEGIPLIKARIGIKKLNISFCCTASHYKGWDFYVDDLVIEKNIFTKKVLTDVLNARKNENNQIELDVVKDVLYDYCIDKNYVFVELDEGILAIPHYNTCNESICSPNNVLDLEDSFFIHQEVDKIQDVINEYRDMINFLESGLFNKDNKNI